MGWVADHGPDSVEDLADYADAGRCGVAAETGRSAVTLTTFIEVPWNQPLHTYLGFRALTENEIGPEPRRVGAGEAAFGLDPSTSCSA